MARRVERVPIFPARPQYCIWDKQPSPVTRRTLRYRLSMAAADLATMA